MAFLYILSEDDNDEIFYQLCLEKLKNKDFQGDFRKLRRGGGIGEVRKKARILLKSIRHTGAVEDCYFVIAIDNDRSPAHPDHQRLPGLSKQDQKKPCRFCEIERTIIEILGKNRSTWPIQGAIAVPIQMLESWLLLICDQKKYQDEASLPIFARKDSRLATEYYKTPENQLKDFKDLEKDQLELSDEDFILHCIEYLNPGNLESASPSFQLFKKQVDDWKA